MRPAATTVTAMPGAACCWAAVTVMPAPARSTGAGDRSVPLARLVASVVTRWRIDEDRQLAEQATGLNSGQVIRWRSWHRWSAPCLLAYMYLAVAVAVHRDSIPARRSA